MAHCLSPGESAPDLPGQLFRYNRVELKGAGTLIEASNHDPLVTINKFGKGKVIFCALPDLLGVDERITPFAAHVLAHLFADVTPIKVSGEVEYLTNRTEHGWVVTLINNRGVLKPQQGLAAVDRNALANVTLSLNGPVNKAREWISDQLLQVNGQRNQRTISLTIAPGGVAVVELETQ